LKNTTYMNDSNKPCTSRTIASASSNHPANANNNDHQQMIHGDGIPHKAIFLRLTAMKIFPPATRTKPASKKKIRAISANHNKPTIIQSATPKVTAKCHLPTFVVPLLEHHNSVRVSVQDHFHIAILHVFQIAVLRDDRDFD
jgi:hypothetical protein